MKRVVPGEIRQLQGWLLAKKQFDDANFVSDVIRTMEDGRKLSFKDSMRFSTLCKTFKTVLLISGKL